MEVSVFAKKDTATNQVSSPSTLFEYFRNNCKTVLSTFSFYCVFPRIPRWTNIRPPTVNRFLFVTGLLQGLSVINNKKCPCILIVDFSSSPTSPSGPVTGPSSTLPETPNSLIGVSSKLAISAHRSPLRKSPAFYLQLLLWRLFLGLLCLPLRHRLRKGTGSKGKKGGYDFDFEFDSDLDDLDSSSFPLSPSTKAPPRDSQTVIQINDD
jgi:hypothetical protein